MLSDRCRAAGGVEGRLRRHGPCELGHGRSGTRAEWKIGYRAPDAVKEAMPDDDAQATELPDSFTPAEVGRACNMSRRAAKNMLRAAGIAECHENGRWFVRTDALRDRLADVYARVLAALVVPS
jgi:hypothetical protein